ncbi:MAG: DinB family protein [Acidimicrobiales bacterium]
MADAVDHASAEIDDESVDGFLDWYRGVVVAKVAGLDRGEATRIATPSGLTLLGIVKHLRWVEEGWFQEKFLGRSLAVRIENPSSFVVDGSDTVASVVAAYQAECARSREVVAEAPARDARAALAHHVFGQVTLHWILVHMVEETARHAGHLDVLRELTDGHIGD